MLLPSSHNTAPPPLRFRGEQATRLARESYLRGPGMETALADDSDPYVGTIPEALIHAGFGTSPADCFARLDRLATELEECRQYPPPYVFPGTQPGKPGFHARTAGRGNFGLVYKLTVGSDHYAFKVFYPKPHRPIQKWESKLNGPYGEAAAGLYLTAHQVKDCAKLYAACPRNQWQLSEWIGPAASLDNRTGITLKALKYRFLDDYLPFNRRNGIRLDNGYLVPDKLHWRALSGAEVICYKALSLVARLFIPKAKLDEAARFAHPPDPEERG